jgi:hypothetical protein
MQQSWGPCMQAAEQVRATGASAMTFDVEAVGPQGAGFDYHRQQGLTVLDRDLMTSVALPPVALAAQRGTLLGMPGDGLQHKDGQANDEEEVGASDSDSCICLIASG